MSVNFLKRYKNEINRMIKTTKNLIDDAWGDDFYVVFIIDSPYGGPEVDSKRGYSSSSLNLRINRVFRKNELKNKIRAIEDNGLIYLGVDLDRSFVKFVIDLFIESESCKDLDEFIIKDFVRYVVFDREKFKFRDYYSNNGSLALYDKPLLFGNIKNYADMGLMASPSGDGFEIEFVDPGWRSKNVDDVLFKNEGKVKSLNYFKVCKNAVNDLYFNLNITVANNEFPKLSNRNFLPIVTVNFDKNVVSYLNRDRYLNKSISFPAYNKGIAKYEIKDFIKGDVTIIYAPTNVLEMEYKGLKCRCNDGSRLPVNLSVD